MGNNCSCLRSKDIENDFTLLSDSYQIKILYNTKNNKNLIKTIIFLQSRIRGHLLRKKASLKLSLSPKFIPYSDPDLPYTAATRPLITQDDIKLLLENFLPLDDGIPVICIKPIEYKNGIQYYGEFNELSNQKHGRGIEKWPNGSAYFGQFKNDMCNGRGKLIFKGGEEYIGDWVDNRATGFGIYKSNEVKYEGKWKDDRQEGIGTESWNDGTTYNGEFKGGYKTGKGKFKYIDGSTYNGQFYNNQLHGKGLYVWADGREYNGDWKFNKIEGEGVFKWPDGRKYTGHYKKDKKDGYGIFEWPDGKKYKGNWVNGKQHGDGELYNPKENVWIKGKWKNGRKEWGNGGNVLSAHKINHSMSTTVSLNKRRPNNLEDNPFARDGSEQDNKEVEKNLVN